MRRRLLAAVCAAAFLAGVGRAGPPGPGFHAGVRVSGATRLDWTFVLGNRSLAGPPAEWGLAGYDAAEQRYDLQVPARRDPKAPAALVLFLSAGKDAGPGKAFARVCRSRGWFYAAPLAAGNDCPSQRRVRIILDVLDDVRRQFPIDPDRTYVAGLSGGGRVACHVAFALPELFGGVVPVCAGGYPREESWLRRRVIERLSVALVTGEKDFNRAEVERFRGPYFKEVGVRSRVWAVRGMGHTTPGEGVLGEVLRWLEGGLARRQALARKHPASRLPVSAACDRASLARALLAEGRERLKAKETLYAGLMQVKGVRARWPDLDAGKEALRLLEEYEAKAEKPWEADDVAEQWTFLVAQAHAMDGYASGALPREYATMRPDMLRSAVALWQQVLAARPDSAAGKEARKRVPELKKLLEKE
jgi:pimeloyl-ACP methyl ester carboxylesterase